MGRRSAGVRSGRASDRDPRLRLVLADRGEQKKVENLRAAVSLHFAHYNFVRVHRTLRVTPAMEARVSNRLWSLDELVERTSN